MSICTGWVEESGGGGANGSNFQLEPHQIEETARIFRKGSQPVITVRDIPFSGVYGIAASISRAASPPSLEHRRHPPVRAALQPSNRDPGLSVCLSVHTSVVPSILLPNANGRVPTHA
jgi:hypothetical protein